MYENWQNKFGTTQKHQTARHGDAQRYTDGTFFVPLFFKNFLVYLFLESQFLLFMSNLRATFTATQHTLDFSHTFENTMINRMQYMCCNISWVGQGWTVETTSPHVTQQPVNVGRDSD